MERNEISIQEAKVYKHLRNNPQSWMTNRDIELAVNIPARTVRAETLKLVKLGIIDQRELFPGHRYRWCDKANKRNTGYLQRLEQAAEMFGI
jgi:predicted transcriptional regulator